MSTEPMIARRTALVAGLTGVGTVALAACGGSGGGSSPQTSAAGNNGDSTAAGGAQAIMALDKIPDGSSAAGKLGSQNVLLYRDGNSVVCFSAVCTHEGCQVNPDGKQFECPCHSSTYDAKTGKVLSGPAPKPLPQIKVKVDDGEVVADA